MNLVKNARVLSKPHARPTKVAPTLSLRFVRTVSRSAREGTHQVNCAAASLKPAPRYKWTLYLILSMSRGIKEILGTT